MPAAEHVASYDSQEELAVLVLLVVAATPAVAAAAATARFTSVDVHIAAYKFILPVPSVNGGLWKGKQSDKGQGYFAAPRVEGKRGGLCEQKKAATSSAAFFFSSPEPLKV
jgi:hypothetical protein